MHLLSVVCSLSFFALYSLANTTTAKQRNDAQIAACRNLTAPQVPFPDPACWDILDMPTWMETWNTSTTTCTSLEDLLTPCQCVVGEPWVTCFMRLTFEGSRIAVYRCTNISLPGACSKPTPNTIVQGPAEIYYGSFSIYVLLQYMSNWATALKSSSAMRAITSQFSDHKGSALSVNSLLSTLVYGYGMDQPLDHALISLFTDGDLMGSGETRPTMANAQDSLGGLLQDIMDTITSNWASGNFQAMAASGMLLNSTGETVVTLEERLNSSNFANAG